MYRKSKKNSTSYKWLAKSVAYLLLLLLIYFSVILIHGSFTDYQPKAEIELEPLQESGLKVISDTTLSMVIWNVGYGGLGAQSDFFYHGTGFFVAAGKMVRTPEPLIRKNIEGVQRFIRMNEADFYLFQEVDVNSKRSYFIDQFEAYLNQLKDYEAYYARNLWVSRIPAPVLQPWKAYGKTDSGLATFSKYKASRAVRYQLPGKYPWPENMFLLDRCVLSTRYALNNGKELVVMNIHNSAFDQDGSIKVQQMQFLKERALEEYEKGNYVVLGGDWNQCPPYFQYDGFMRKKSEKHPQANIPADLYPSDWQWIYDPTQPTNRKTEEIYQAGKTFVTLIDFYLLSPNLRALQVKTINQAFEYSDHQPVHLKLELLY